MDLLFSSTIFTCTKTELSVHVILNFSSMHRLGLYFLSALVCDARVYTDVDHIGSTFGGTIDIDICSTFAGLFNRHWHCLESVPNFLHFFSWKCLKSEPFCGCVCVCVYIYIYIYIYKYINIWFCIFFKILFWFFLGLFPVINRYIFDIPSTFAGNPVDIRHRHLQTSESTSVYTLTSVICFHVGQARARGKQTGFGAAARQRSRTRVSESTCFFGLFFTFSAVVESFSVCFPFLLRSEVSSSQNLRSDIELKSNLRTRRYPISKTVEKIEENGTR